MNVPIIVMLQVVMKVGVTVVAGDRSYLVYKCVPTRVYKTVVLVVVMEVALGVAGAKVTVLVLVPPMQEKLKKYSPANGRRIPG